MPAYSLLDANTKKALPSTTAEGREAALEYFGRILGRRLTDTNLDDSVNRYLLDEWQEGDAGHWINHITPVWVCEV